MRRIDGDPQRDRGAQQVAEQRVDTLKTEEFLENNFRSMTSACQRNLRDKILVIEWRTALPRATARKSTCLCQNTSSYKMLAFKAGYSVTKDGSLKVSKGTPITFAIRQADFGTTLARMGI